MDWAAATPLHPRVVTAMRRVETQYGNPSASHAEGRAARDLIEEARTRIARILSVKAAELIFTSGGTEANNLALGWVPADGHTVLSAFEHPSVTRATRGQISLVQPNSSGIVTPDAVAALVTTETALVSIVLVQSEIGTVQPVKDIARAVKAKNPHTKIHTDASQAPLWMDASPHAFGVDLATYDAQKIMGPKGVGILWRAPSVDLVPVVRGGGQERGIRPGTENTAAIVGMAEAFEQSARGRKERAEKVAKMRDYFVELLKKEVSQVEINGSLKHRVSNNVHISIPGADGDYLAVLMDTRGIAVSARSACVADGEPSTAVLAIGKSESHARGTVRFTFGPSVTKADVARSVRALQSSLRVIFDRK